MSEVRHVVATLAGTTRPDDWYIVGGHYDSISTNDGNATAPGCEDNASGSAAVLEMARIFSATKSFHCAGAKSGSAPKNRQQRRPGT